MQTLTLCNAKLQSNKNQNRKLSSDIATCAFGYDKRG